MTNEYSTPVIVKVDRLVGSQIAHVTVNSLTEENNTFTKENYVIVADSTTSCNASIGHLKEGDSYYFGFPLNQIDNDEISYHQCMWPFYELNVSINLASCLFNVQVEQLKMSPNVIQDGFTSIQNQLIRPLKLSIFNLSGQLILEQFDIAENGHVIELPNDMVNGIYIVKVFSSIATNYSANLVIAR